MRQKIHLSKKKRKLSIFNAIGYSVIGSVLCGCAPSSVPSYVASNTNATVLNAGTGAASVGSFNIFLSGGNTSPYPNITHLWVTISSIGFNASTAANAPPLSDSSWTIFPLTQPITVDSVNGKDDLQNLFSLLFYSAGIFFGNYSYIALGIADTALTNTDGTVVARAVYDNTVIPTDSNNRFLIWNNQIEWTQNGVITEWPLDYPLYRGLIIKNNNALVMNGIETPAILDINTQMSVIPYYDNLNKIAGFLLNPAFYLNNQSSSGAINGSLDQSVICSNSYSNIIETPSASLTCADSIKIRAEYEDSPHHFSTVLTTEPQSDGSFVLSPLPVVLPQTGFQNTSTGSNNALTYDVVISGHNMHSIIIRNVPLTASNTTIDNSLNATTIPMIPITLSDYISVNSSRYSTNVIKGLGYLVQLSAPNIQYPLNRIEVRQNIPNSIDKTIKDSYVISAQWTDPITGLLPQALYMDTNAIDSATYNASGLVYTPIISSDGLGVYTIGYNNSGWGFTPTFTPTDSTAFISVNPPISSTPVVSINTALSIKKVSINNSSNTGTINGSFVVKQPTLIQKIFLYFIKNNQKVIAIQDETPVLNNAIQTSNTTNVVFNYQQSELETNTSDDFYQVMVKTVPINTSNNTSAFAGKWTVLSASVDLTSSATITLPQTSL